MWMRWIRWNYRRPKMCTCLELSHKRKSWLHYIINVRNFLFMRDSRATILDHLQQAIKCLSQKFEAHLYIASSRIPSNKKFQNFRKIIEANLFAGYYNIFLFTYSRSLFVAVTYRNDQINPKWKSCPSPQPDRFWKC